MPACSEKPELSATSGRGASGSAGSVHEKLKIQVAQ
jgi:hypothetical protein